MQDDNKSYYKAFLNFAAFSFIIGTFLWFYSPIAQLDWGKWKVPQFQNMYPFVTLSLGTIAVFVFKREVKFVQSQQLNKNYRIVINVLEMQIKDLTKELNLTEEKANSMLSKMKYLSQLKEIPDLAIYLITKFLNTMEQFKVELNIQINGSLDSLKNIQVEDLKQTINMLLTPIYNNFDNINEEDRRDINLFIREQDNKVTLKLMHDYVGNPINAETVQWNMKKLLHKYGANLIVENEREEESDLYVLCLTIDIPKENKVRKIG